MSSPEFHVSPELNVQFEPSYAIKRLQELPQSQVIKRLYRATKGNDSGSYVDKHIEEITCRHEPDPWKSSAIESWDDPTMERIVGINPQPQTLEETELLHLWNLRRAMSYLGYRCLWASGLPPEVEQAFSTRHDGDEAHLDNEELGQALHKLSAWSREQPEQDTPLVLDEAGQQAVGNVCERANTLVSFYNAHATQLLAYNPDFEDSMTHISNGASHARLLLVRGMLSLFGTDENSAAVMTLAEGHLTQMYPGWYRQPPNKLLAIPEASPLPFSEQGMLEKVYRTPISILLYNLVEYPHDNSDAGTAYFKLQNRLEEAIDLTDESNHRIFLGEGPRTADEEEFFHLVNLRGALGGLMMRLMGNANFPSEVREALQQNAFEHAKDDVMHAVRRTSIVGDYIYGVSSKHSEMRDGEWVALDQDDLPPDPPPAPEAAFAQQVSSVYAKALQLLAFYQSERPEVFVEWRESIYYDPARSGARVVPEPPRPGAIVEQPKADDREGQEPEGRAVVGAYDTEHINRLRSVVVHDFIKMFDPAQEPETLFGSTYIPTYTSQQLQARHEAWLRRPESRAAMIRAYPQRD